MGARIGAALLQRADLRGTVLCCAYAQRADMRDTRLSGGNLRLATLVGAALAGAALERAVLENASLRGASLGAADLRGAEMSGADLRGARPTCGVCPRDADLRAADLRRATLVGAQLNGARFDDATLWPRYFEPRPRGCVYCGEPPEVVPADGPSGRGDEPSPPTSSATVR